MTLNRGFEEIVKYWNVLIVEAGIKVWGLIPSCRPHATNNTINRVATREQLNNLIELDFSTYFLFLKNIIVP